MEEHETRRKIIRQWMALPKDKRSVLSRTSPITRARPLLN
jgi:hypothetical protein